MAPRDEEAKAAAAEEEWSEDQAAFLPTWDFAKSGPFVGVVEESEIVSNVEGIDGSARDVPLFTVRHDDGERYSIWGSGMLERVLPKVIGQRVKITDKGLEPGRKQGTTLRVFEVLVAKSSR